MKSNMRAVNWCAALIVITNTTAFAQDSSLSERDEQLIYSRAFEAIL